MCYSIYLHHCTGCPQYDAHHISRDLLILELHPPQKFERPEIFPCLWPVLVVMLTIFCLVIFLPKKTLAITASVFFFFCARKLAKPKFICLLMKEKCQHQHKGKPHTSKKSQDAATSMEDAVTNTVHTSKIETSFMCS
jgi:hypothetical protein